MKAMTAIIAALGLVVAMSQADAKPYKHHRHHASKSHHKMSYSRSLHGRAGGHRLGYENEPFLYRNGGYGNTPFNDARNFWERVQSGPFDEQTSPSAF